MNIIFFASSHFAYPSLEALRACGQKILALVTQPDRKRGRGLHLEGTFVKRASAGEHLLVYQPQDINSPEAVQFLKALNADLFVVISYGQILSQELLDIPKWGAVNLHASLLPAYRGAAPINWAIMKGETVTGVTLMKMVRKMDAGPVICQQKLPIGEQDDVLTIEDKLSRLAGKLLVEGLEKINKKSFDSTPQDEEKVSFAPKLKKGDGLIDWQIPALKIHNLIRGCLLWPGAFTYLNGKLLKIHKARVTSRFESSVKRSAGRILKATKEGIVVATTEDDLTIEKLQMEGKRVMEAREFLAGHKVSPSAILGK